MTYGKCPSCETVVTYLTAKPVEIKDGTTNWKGVTYQCPLCTAVLGCEIDPLALKNEIVSEAKRAIGR